MSFGNFPFDSGYMIVDLESQVSDEMVDKFLADNLDNYESKIKGLTQQPVKLARIFNTDEDDINTSKRWQLPITQNMNEAKSELVKMLTKKISRLVQFFNKDFDIIKRLVLISEPQCEQQKIHKDAESDDANEFYVAIFTLQKNTELIIVDEEGGIKKMELKRKQLIILDSKKHHAGGSNNTEQYNCRLHFKMGDKKAHKKSDYVGFPLIKCKDCGAIKNSKDTLKYHRQYRCDWNPNKMENVRRMSATRKRKRQNSSNSAIEPVLLSGDVPSKK